MDYATGRTEVMNRKPGQVPTENQTRQRRRQRNECATEWVNCHTTTGNDTELLVHTKLFLIAFSLAKADKKTKMQRNKGGLLCAGFCVYAEQFGFFCGLLCGWPP